MPAHTRKNHPNLNTQDPFEYPSSSTKMRKKLKEAEIILKDSEYV